MALELSYVLYDTAFFGTTAGTEHVLFQNAQGSTATATESNTNSRGAGSLPQQEQYIIQRVGVYPDQLLPEADISAIWTQSFFELRVGDLIRLKLPLVACAQYSAYSGHFTQATAANRAYIGVMNDGYALEIPIVVNGGELFRPRIYQGTAVSAANTRVKLLFHGILRLP